MSILFAEYDLLTNSSLFDPEYYVSTNPEIGALNLDPVLHYLEAGAGKNLNPSAHFDAAYYLEQCRRSGDSPTNPLVHYLTVGAARGLKPVRDAADTIEATDTQDESMLSIDGAAFIAGEDGSYQVSIVGWALAPEAVSRLTLECNGAPLGAAKLGLERLDVAKVLPTHAHALNSGFSLLAAIPEANRATTLNLDCLMTTEGGKTYRHQRRVASGPRASLEPSESAEPVKRARVKREAVALRLEVDEATVDEDAILSVNGWAVGILEITAINVYVDDESIGTADHGRTREDVALAHKGYPGAATSGFGFNADLSRFGAGERTVKIEAVSAGGIRRLALIQVSIPARNEAAAGDGPFHFFCDSLSLNTAGQVAVAGWLIAGTTTDSITVLLDEIEIGRATTGRERADVGKAFRHIIYARNSGFSFREELKQPVAAGEHQIVLRVKDAAGHVRDVPLPVVAENAPAPELETAVSAAAASAALDAISLSIDAPSVTQGVADRSVIGTLSINGWALAPAGIRDVAIAIDGTFVTHAQHGIRRDDVGNAFPDRPDALQSGFATVIPYWLLPKGSHTVSLTVRDQAEHEASVQFGIEVEETPEGDGPWSLRRKMNQAEIDVQISVLEGLEWQPQFTVVVRAEDDEASLRDLKRTLSSVLDQAYPHWQVSVVAKPGRAWSKASQAAVLKDLHIPQERVRFCQAPDSFEAPRRAGAPVKAQELFIVPLAAGDELGCDALLELAAAGGLARGCEVLFADERCVSSVSGTLQAYFKPGWSPDLLLSTNYVGRPWCASLALVKRAGLSPKEWLTHGDYDTVLRATEAATGVRHVPKVLASRGARFADSEALERRALTRALARRKLKGRIEAGCAPRFYRVVPKKAAYGRVSIIIPTRASRGLIKICLDTLKEKTAYRDFEIICIENIPDEQSEWKTWLKANADIVLETAEPFNWSRYNNLCAAKASGRFLLFLNDDIEVLEPDWLDTLLANAARPEVGIVGPQLLYPDRTVQHAGLALTSVLGRARHVFRHGREDDPGYFGLALAQRNVIAVTGACMLMKRETFDALGGFDEAYNVINNDLDMCLRAWKRGLLIVYTPHTKLIHHEMISRAKLGDAFDSSAFITAWRDVFLDGDPYLNRNLSRDSDDLLPEREPITAICTGNPLFARDSIRRILVMKVDHIGDCITALPAIRKLKTHFPEARITVLSGSATRLVWSMEAVADEVLEFNFFHARSQLGTVGVSEEALVALGETLAPHRFDLAVDLRKSPDTRHVLKYTGAKYLAGYDYQSQFPWLDVALEWEGDPGRTSKRKSIADDLINLVDAISASGESARQPVERQPKALTSLSAADAAGLFDRPLVCIHAGAGNELKAWPAGSFRELIDLLVERDGVQVALIGGPAESALSDDIIQGVREPKWSRNLAGKLPLNEIPDLFLRARLFIGNDSGPKHIAAALGVPTVGIHSGNIDAREWGPVGPNAVAVWRQTSCSPCYIDKAVNCPRQLACLHGIGAGEVYRLCHRILQIGLPKALQPAEHKPLRRIRGAPIPAIR